MESHKIIYLVEIILIVVLFITNINNFTDIRKINDEIDVINQQIEAIQFEQSALELTDLTEVNEPITPVSTESKYEACYLGKFEITAYCHCAKCCGKSDGITASGTKTTADRTIAVDPRIIPLGSKILIDGKIYVAEDVGGGIKGNHIDIYFPSHQAALNFGRQYKDVNLVYEV